MLALVDYASSSSSEGEECTRPAALKRPALLPTAVSLLGAKAPKSSVDDAEDCKENPELHGGRIRSFKHERGNWATYVYVPTTACMDQLEEFQSEAIEKMSQLIKLQANEGLHLSLSKTVVLQHHQIDEYSRSLQQALHSKVGFSSTLRWLQVYTNEERTRTFLAVELDAAYRGKMTELLQPIDLVMREYRLAQFYAPPSFHISLLWCVGDQEQLLLDKLDELQQILDAHDTLKLDVNEVRCKCGNKQFRYKLR
ncbi:CG16790 [Drosophila busckii]|uniref:U6 snRNA phosphodiesterase n=1 Tax=Drosophila busckii TaxID=30019 RepID=A0A0M4F4X0_DROBS|nr:U6 snRNA phosphodiesterase [Drosophila busckii]ALC46875.1 CG16790 [Drosophila busckii]